MNGGPPHFRCILSTRQARPAASRKAWAPRCSTPGSTIPTVNVPLTEGKEGSVTVEGGGKTLYIEWLPLSPASLGGRRDLAQGLSRLRDGIL